MRTNAVVADAMDGERGAVPRGHPHDARVRPRHLPHRRPAATTSASTSYLPLPEPAAGPDRSGRADEQTRMLDELARPRDRRPRERSALPRHARALRDGPRAHARRRGASSSSPTRSRRARYLRAIREALRRARPPALRRERGGRPLHGGRRRAPPPRAVHDARGAPPRAGADARREGRRARRRDDARPRRAAARALRRGRSRAGRPRRRRGAAPRVPPLASVEGRVDDALVRPDGALVTAGAHRSRARRASTGVRLWQVNQRTPERVEVDVVADGDAARAVRARRARASRRCSRGSTSRRASATAIPIEPSGKFRVEQAPLPARPRAACVRGSSERWRSRRATRSHRRPRRARVRPEFPMLARELDGQPLVFLDSASTTPKPRAVIDAVVDYYERCTANVHRGVHALGEEATRLYDAARLEVAGLIGAAPGRDRLRARDDRGHQPRRARARASGRTTRSSSPRASTTPTGSRGASTREAGPDADRRRRRAALGDARVAPHDEDEASSPSATSRTSPAAIAPVDEVVARRARARRPGAPRRGAVALAPADRREEARRRLPRRELAQGVRPERRRHPLREARAPAGLPALPGRRRDGRA